MFNIFNKIRLTNVNEVSNYDQEINNNILNKVVTLLGEINTKVIFDTRSDRFTIANGEFDIQVLVNQSTSTITMVYTNSVENSIHDKFTIDSIRDMSETFTHNEFVKELNEINSKRLANLREKEFIKPLEATAE